MSLETQRVKKLCERLQPEIFVVALDRQLSRKRVDEISTSHLHCSQSNTIYYSLSLSHSLTHSLSLSLSLSLSIPHHLLSLFFSENRIRNGNKNCLSGVPAKKCVLPQKTLSVEFTDSHFINPPLVGHEATLAKIPQNFATFLSLIPLDHCEQLLLDAPELL